MPEQNQMNQKDPKHYISPEDNKKANILTGISLGCMVLFVVVILMQGSDTMEALTTMQSEGAKAFLSCLTGALFIAAIVLLIIVRVKYPANKFAKIVMWIYIVLAVLAVIAMVLLLIACYIACGEFSKGAGELWDCIEGCGRIG